MLGRNWKTTALGILGILITLLNALKALLDGGHLDIAQTVVGLTTGIGLIEAKDHDVAGVSKK